MCGIAGYSLSSDSQSVPTWLQYACSRLGHRGPDDCGVFTDHLHSVGLAHTRLSIVDLSPSGHQPMCSADGSVALVFNGEIYNHRILREELVHSGFCFRGHSDTEVLLALYLHHRFSVDTSAFIRMLDGIFSFAIWDSVKLSTLLVRDPFGVKPLYYCQAPTGLFFSSEIKAFPHFPLTLDPASIDLYLSHLWCPGAGTPALEIRKLGPGEMMWLSSGSIQKHSAWFTLAETLPVSNDSLLATSPSVNSFIEGTACHLRAAVCRQMVSDVPVGAFLSGGLDSSSIVAFAKETNPDIACFTVSSDASLEDGHSNDLPYARRVASHLGVPLEIVPVDPLRMAADLESLVLQLDEPLADPAALNVYYISRRAKEFGVKVLLSGSGGDDLFTGYRRHQAIENDWIFDCLPRFARSFLARSAQSLDKRRPALRRLAKFLDLASLTREQRLLHYFRWIGRDDLDKLYSSDFLLHLKSSASQDPMLSFLANLPSDLGRMQTALLLEQRFFLADHNLVYTDKMSMAAGVEVRVPFLDLALVRFAAGIPLRYKQRGRESKWILKKAMEPYLPLDIIYRPKSGFGVPLRRWLRIELRDWLADLLSPSRLRQRGLFDPSAVQRLMIANDCGQIDASYTLLSLACIEIWCRHFLDTAPQHSEKTV
jgi:asparagine synthase (glutamine-hydrolysing)